MRFVTNAVKLAEMESTLKESKVRETEFRQLSDRAQREVDSYVSSINTIQTRYMEALKERGIYDAECKVAKEEALGLSRILESRQAEISTLKAARTELEKKLAEANDALLHSTNPELVKMAQLENDLSAANAQVQHLERKVAVMQSDTDYSKNMYNTASQRGSELASENRGYEKQIEQLQRQADANIVEVNRVQARNEVRALAQQVKELKNVVRERDTELNRVREELKALKSGRRETRQSSVPRSPRLNSLGTMSPRNGARVPSAMGGPSSSRGTSPAPATGIFDMSASSGNGVQNAAAFTQGPGANRLSHLRDQRF
jgi:chromosome segregation ATPase